MISGRSRVRPHPLLQPFHPQLVYVLADGLRERALRAPTTNMVATSVSSKSSGMPATTNELHSGVAPPAIVQVPKGADVEGASSRASDVLECLGGKLNLKSAGRQAHNVLQLELLVVVAAHGEQAPEGFPKIVRRNGRRSPFRIRRAQDGRAQRIPGQRGPSRRGSGCCNVPLDPRAGLSMHSARTTRSGRRSEVRIPEGAA